ncbi:hypothetical protein A0H76_2516 [Hepatospora eriocheir]|uniref:ISXO2-like transposase domain-containing protein n=1 Tax=Hepatospora eriocheir TaxID=1081669 RepID=A0A1X0QJT6_9MICR|nr:hypothetical protein A0H76_2516 [Hepatospora eriocheir]
MFGLADVSYTPTKISLHLVSNRVSSTLIPIIERVCAPSIVIHSDEWNAYLDITSRLRFSYSTINHGKSFVNAFTGIHIHNIKSAWNR